jgi:phosphatidylserine/phosphatidylglycerophosphate/cardiolipin synthase-like enzyme
MSDEWLPWEALLHAAKLAEDAEAARLCAWQTRIEVDRGDFDERFRDAALASAELLESAARDYDRLSAGYLVMSQDDVQDNVHKEVREEVREDVEDDDDADGFW